MTLAPGTPLDDFEILGPLGAGGMGEVFRARDSKLKREVAVKILLPYVSQDPDRLRRFEQEAQAAAALNHPNILVIYLFGTFEGAPYLVSDSWRAARSGNYWHAAHYRPGRRMGRRLLSKAVLASLSQKNSSRSWT